MKRFTASFLICLLLVSCFAPLRSSAADSPWGDSVSVNYADTLGIDFSDVFGSWCANIGYVIGDYIPVIGTGMMGIADVLLSDEKKAEYSKRYGFSDWQYLLESEDIDYTDYFKMLIDSGYISIDTAEKILTTDESILTALQTICDSLERDYALYYIPSASDLVYSYRPFTDRGNGVAFSVSDNYIKYVDSCRADYYDYGDFCLDNVFFVAGNSGSVSSITTYVNAYNNYFLPTLCGDTVTDTTVSNYYFYSVYNCASYSIIKPSSYTRYSYSTSTGLTTSTVGSASLSGVSARLFGAHLYYVISKSGLYVPVFKSITAYDDYVRGKSDIYSYDSGYTGGDITVSTDFDYEAFGDQVRQAIKDAGTLNTSDIQEAIEKASKLYLQSMVISSNETADNTKIMVGILNSINSNLLDFKDRFLDYTNESLTAFGSVVSSVKEQGTAIVDALSNLNFVSNVTNNVTNNYETVNNITENNNNFYDLLNNFNFTFEVPCSTVPDDGDLPLTADGYVDVSYSASEWFDYVKEWKFPFSLASDVSDIMDLFVSDPAEPSFEVKLSGGSSSVSSGGYTYNYVDSDGNFVEETILASSNDVDVGLYDLGDIGFTIDFSFIDSFMPAVRALEVIIFLFTLVWMTHNFVCFMGDFL